VDVSWNYTSELKEGNT